MHQGSILSPLLLILVLEEPSEEFRSSLPSELLYADDLIIISKTLEEPEGRYYAWKTCMENKGL